MAGNGFISIHVGAFGLQTKARQLATFGHLIEDLSPAWAQIGADFELDFARNFDEEGGVFGGIRSYLGSNGGAWKQLAASTVTDRLRKGYGGAHPILVREGALRASLTDQGADGNIFEATPTGLTIGTSIPYAGFHQTGTTRMPARPIVGISWHRRSAIVQRLDQYVKNQISDSVGA